MKSTKLLITGGSGMLGSALTTGLDAKRFSIEHKRFEITSQKEITEVAKKLNNVDYIIHCAAMTNVDECELDKKKCFDVNVQGTENIIELANNLNARLIFISTPMVFSGETGDYKENDITSPINYYGKSKLQAERKIQEYPRGLILRMNPIGIRTSGSHPSFIQWFVNAAKKNKSFTLFSDVIINPISTDTFVKLVPKIFEHFESGALHLGSVDTVNKSDVWKYILGNFPNFSGTVKISPVNTTNAGKIAQRPQRMWLNVDKAKKFFNIPDWEREIDIVLKGLL